jgi:hypothetical protein
MDVVSAEGAGVVGDWACVVAGLAAGETGLAASGLTALLEITNLRLAGAALAFEVLGLLFLLRGALFDAVALRFNINFQTIII